jgi:MFS family permease
MMKEKNITIIEMGLVVASLPLIMQFSRMLFAIVSDYWGRKPFFVSNGILGVLSCLIYYGAYLPVQFLSGKIVEGVREGTIWAVNRPFLLERSGGHWRILVHLRTVLYISFAAGSLLAGFLIVWFFYEGTMLFCALIGVLVTLLSLLLKGEKRRSFTFKRALPSLDFRKKTRIFNMFLILYLVLGVSYGFRSMIIVTLFLDNHGFATEPIGVILGVQLFLAGLFSYLFSKSKRMEMLILFSGISFAVIFSLLGFLDPFFAVVLLIVYGVIEGVTSIGQEGILARISDKSSYGADIGLLMMGLHIGETISLALSGFLVSLWGYTATFLMAAMTYAIFSVASYVILVRWEH